MILPGELAPAVEWFVVEHSLGGRRKSKWENIKKKRPSRFVERLFKVPTVILIPQLLAVLPGSEKLRAVPCFSLKAGSKYCSSSDLIVGGVHICKLVGDLNHLIMLSGVSSKSLVIIFPISGEWAS